MSGGVFLPESPAEADYVVLVHGWLGRIEPQLRRRPVLQGLVLRGPVAVAVAVLGRGPDGERGAVVGPGPEGGIVASQGGLLPVVVGGRPSGNPGGLPGAEYPPQGLVSVDVFGLGGAGGDHYQVVAVVGVLAGSLGNLAGIVAEVVEHFVDCAGCLFTAEEVVPGVGAIAVEVVVLVIIGFEVKGAGLHFVAVIVRGVGGIAAPQGVDPSTG